jgi:hypothetical protein
LRRSVWQASASSSTRLWWANPACSRPSAWPPAPAQISAKLSWPAARSRRRSPVAARQPGHPARPGGQAGRVGDRAAPPAGRHRRSRPGPVVTGPSSDRRESPRPGCTRSCPGGVR